MNSGKMHGQAYDGEQLLQQKVENLQLINSALRKEKHDFANHLQVILGQCAYEKDTALEDISSYIYQVVDKISQQIRFFDTGNSFVDSLLSVKSARAYECEITFEACFEVPLAAITIKTADLISILGNLIDNAFEAMHMSHHKGGVISVGSYIENERYHLSVSNTGTHIPKEHLRDIFKEGFSTKGNDQKRGYGLSIVYSLVQRSGGTIFVQSNENETEFLMVFPLNA